MIVIAFEQIGTAVNKPVSHIRKACDILFGFASQRLSADERLNSRYLLIKRRMRPRLI